MSLNPISEIKYRYRLAAECLERSERLFSLRDWVGTVSSSQLAVENFAKSIIAIFEIPTWSHDPSDQLKSLIERLPSGLKEDIREMAIMVKEMASEHGRSTYGEPSAGLLPSDIYKEEHALSALERARRAGEITREVFNQLKIEL